MGKVYCKDCIHIGQEIPGGALTDRHCEHPSNILKVISNDWYESKTLQSRISTARRINANNDCKNFEKVTYREHYAV